MDEALLDQEIERAIDRDRGEPAPAGRRYPVRQVIGADRPVIGMECFKRLPPPSVLDMASSHAWNLGASATCGSGAMQAWNRGEWERGCQRISRGDDGTVVWSFVSRIDPKTGKKVYVIVQGLANRRADEPATCAEGLK